MFHLVDFRASLSLLVIVALVLVGPTAGCKLSCGSGGHEQKLQTTIAEQLARKYGREVDKVDCPKEVEGDAVANCTATLADGEAIAVEARWSDAAGDFSLVFKRDMGAFMKDIGALISAGLASKYGAEFSGVSCPAVELEKSGVFECVATIASGSLLPVTVTWTNDNGAIRYADKGVVLLDKLERILGEQLTDMKTPGTVDCHGRIRAAEPASNFTCDIAFADAKSGKVEVSVQDWGGKVDWEYQ